MSTGKGNPSYDQDRERVAAQLKIWREHLIDLTRRNPMLGINRSRTSKLSIVAPSASDIFDRVVIDGRKLRMPLVLRRPARSDLFTSIEEEPASPWEVRRGDVEIDAEPADIFKRLRRIKDNARTTVEERGVVTLHLALGALHFSDLFLGDSIAPLWLIPCSLKFTGTESPLLLVGTDEEPLLNPALALYLRERHQKTLPPLPDKPDRAVISRLIEETRALFSGNWRVTDEVWLSTFSFETLAIYRDLDALAEVATGNGIVRAIAGATLSVESSERLGDDLDSLASPSMVPVPVLPADSSQLEALTYARQGQHVLVYGPPGTGKSQTIANLIGDALGQGKTVLFVSAKMAALDVVFDRLSRLGFARFCLEAHSTKAGKVRIIDELRRTLEAASQSSGVDYQAELSRYQQMRETLNQTVRELHQRREPLGYSIYRGIGEVAKREQLPNVESVLPWPDVTAVNPEQLQAVVDALADLQAQAALFAERNTHPWRGCRAPDASYATLDAVSAALGTVQAAIQTILMASADLEPFLGPLGRYSLSDLERASEALNSLAAVSWLPVGWTTTPVAELKSTAALLQTASLKATSVEKGRSVFAERTDGADPIKVCPVLAPALDRFSKWYKRLLPAYFGWKRQVQAEARPKSTDFKFISSLATFARATVDDTAWLEENRRLAAFVRRPGQAQWVSPQDFDDAAQAFAAGASLRTGLERLGAAVPDKEVRQISPAVQMAAHAVQGQIGTSQPALGDALARLDQSWGSGFALNLAAREASLVASAARCAEALAAPDRWVEWVLFQQSLDRCVAVGLASLVDGLDPYGTEQAVQLFRRRFWHRWTDAQITRIPALQAFRGARREDIIGEFASVDVALRKAIISATIESAAARAAQINNTGYVARESQLGILRRELQRTRPRPLRQLFADIPQVLQAIKPCMLMSPVSVSTYLAPGSIDFDIVVFDEASQLPPQETIPSILRSRQAVVAGDGKQLPPTSFFSSALFAEETEDEEGEDGQPLESLLQECEATVPLFRPAPLRWHYRSRDERLIAFSNHYFYEGSLITFPCPGSSSESGVQLNYIENGVWDRGKSRTNRAEARAAAAMVVTQLDRHPERSIGVVALNIAQKEAIEDALEEALASRPELRELVAPRDKEPFFVKSIENVQGDERDTIIVSIGYGPDINGNVALNFGPLNQEGGWRRLNVLVTRAKHLTVLTTSLRSAQLSGISPKNRGAMALKQFIEYAERGGRVPPELARPTTAETNDFEDAIAAALRSRGLIVDEQVGVSSYRIDLAIRDPRDPNWYLLGIECDGATYHSSRTARDRDLLRAAVLRDMGWRLHRIWSVDWFRNPKDTIAAVVRSVERAVAQGKPEAGVQAPPPSASSTQNEQRKSTASTGTSGPGATPQAPRFPPGTPYRRAQVVSYKDPGVLMDPRVATRLAGEIVRIVKAESPIHLEVLLERLKELHGVQRAGSRIVGNFERTLEWVVSTSQLRCDTKGFLWHPLGTLATFRVPGSANVARAIEHIPPEEIRLVILHLVESQFGMPRDALMRETARLLGFGQTTAVVGDTIGGVVDVLIEAGELRLSGFQVTWP